MNDAGKAVDDAGKFANDLARDAGGSAATGDYDRLEKDMTTVKHDVAQLSQKITDAVNALGSIAQGETRRGLRRARANVNAFASDASDRAGSAADAMTVAAQDAASSIGDTLSDAVEQRPVASLALAMGIGFLIGVTWRR